MKGSLEIKTELMVNIWWRLIWIHAKTKRVWWTSLTIDISDWLWWHGIHIPPCLEHMVNKEQQNTIKPVILALYLEYMHVHVG
jgi:hypothetical protein